MTTDHTDTRLRERGARDVTIEGRARGSIATERVTVRRVCECEVDRLFAQHHLSRDQHRAGSRFRAAWMASAYRGVSMMRLEAKTRVAPSVAPQEAYADARAVLDAASGVVTPDQWLALVAVCGEDESAKRRLKVLQAGLDVLVEWWGLRP